MADGNAKAKINDAQVVAHASIEEALAAAQQEFPEIEKSKTGKVKGESKATGKAFEFEYKYADIADILKVIRPILGKHGIAVTQSTQIEGRALTIKSVLRFRAADGPQTIESDYPVCEVVADHQRMGGALTYARRYAFCALVGIAPDEDIDGNGAAPTAAPERKTAARVQQQTRAAQRSERSLKERAASCRKWLSEATTEEELNKRWDASHTLDLRDALDRSDPDELLSLSDHYAQELSRFEGAFA